MRKKFSLAVAFTLVAITAFYVGTAVTASYANNAPNSGDAQVVGVVSHDGDIWVVYDSYGRTYKKRVP
jgi:hypothetical protein